MPYQTLILTLTNILPFNSNFRPIHPFLSLEVLLQCLQNYFSTEYMPIWQVNAIYCKPLEILKSNKLGDSSLQALVLYSYPIP